MYSNLYVGRVRHRRFTPRDHQFSYSLFMLYLDLDELPTLFQTFWLWSTEKSNIASFRRHNHLGDKDENLKQCVYDLVEQQTGRRPNGPVRLLTNLAYFGFRFNPVSFYYCFDVTGEHVEYIVAEVNNTPWGEQYCYVMDAQQNLGSEKKQRYSAQKRFHVSPFMPMDIQYDWRMSSPNKQLSVHMENHQDGEKIFDATLQLKRHPIDHKKMAWVLFKYPFMTVKIVGAIYFEALRLWFKKVPFIDHPGQTSKEESNITDTIHSKEAPHSVKTS